MARFFDNYKDTGGLSFIGQAEKAELITGGVVMEALRVFRTADTFANDGSERDILVVSLDGEERALGFKVGTVESRDHMLAALSNYLQQDDAEPVNIKLVKRGRSVLVVDADAEQE